MDEILTLIESVSEDFSFLLLNVYLDMVSRPLLPKYRQEMDADKLLIYLQRIYCARVLFVCIVCIRQFRYTTCILVEGFDIDRCILSSLFCKRLL